MDITNNPRLGQRQEIVVALEIAGMLLKTLAPVPGLVQLVTLDHGAHGTVQNQDPFRQELFELCHRLDFV